MATMTYLDTVITVGDGMEEEICEAGVGPHFHLQVDRLV
jgi:hypothetical protein